jgi:hypothetical protein
MQGLLDRGARQFKFVDRTFNLNIEFSRSILEFFLERYQPGLFVHFEMVPDRLPEPLRAVIRRFPQGALQFEVGVQTLNPRVEQLISRRQNQTRLEDNLRWLRDETAVHIHADLIVGLPGEDVASFGRGFDRLVTLRPHEIQVGMLKRLRGTPITRHDEQWKMIYSPHPPYEVLQTSMIDFESMQQMRRFSRFWDLLANSGNFVLTLPMLLADAPFGRFMAFAEWLWVRAGHRTHGIALDDLATFAWTYLVETGMSPSDAADVIVADYARTGRDAPVRIAAQARSKPVATMRRERVSMKRQARHLA